MIHNPGKYAARLGLGFSGTYPLFEINPNKIQVIPDIKRRGYIFSDGIGYIS
jgi:RNA-dependent RNA polymerase